jgi:tRNA(Ile)-lysidine synthase
MSGPDPAVAAVRHAVRHAVRLSRPADGPVFVACSGGADSLALAAALAFEAPRAGVAAGLITIDHGLQPGSDEQARRVAAIGYELGLDPVHLIRVDVPGFGGLPTAGEGIAPKARATGGPEAAARAARYAALDAAAEGGTVLLGHTLDDQAETVLLGLGRGSGPRSIAGMRAVAGHYRRPLLRLRRATTVAACAALGLIPWDDPHNADPRFQRVRLRTEVLPLLEDVLQGGVAEALARTADLLQADLDALDRAASVHLEAGVTVSVDTLEGLEPAIRSRVLRDWLHAQGVAPGDLSGVHLAAVEALITAWRGQGPIALPGRFELTRDSGTLSVRDSGRR